MNLRLIVVILVLSLLLSLSFIVTGCTEQKQVSEPASPTEASDKEILAQYPDDLDAALEELNAIE